MTGGNEACAIALAAAADCVAGAAARAGDRGLAVQAQALAQRCEALAEAAHVAYAGATAALDARAERHDVAIGAALAAGAEAAVRVAEAAADVAALATASGEEDPDANAAALLARAAARAAARFVAVNLASLPGDERLARAAAAVEAAG